MTMNQYPCLPNCYYCSMSYHCFPFNECTMAAVDDHRFRPSLTAQQLRYYLPLPYPYAWSEDGEVAIIDSTHSDDIRRLPPSSSTTATQQLQTIDGVHPLHPYLHLEIVDEVAILQDLYLDQSNESSQQEAAFHGYNGLTMEIISKNLIEKQTNYCQENEAAEICVICQVEYENDETLGVLQCKHRYHAECIKEWLLHKNVCPVCKAEALTV